MNGKRYNSRRQSRTGFYLALAVCLVAVGVAAWSTFDAVNSYNHAQSSAAARSSAASQAGKDDPMPSARGTTVPAPSVSAAPERTASQSASSTVPRDVTPAAPSPAAGTPSPIVSSSVRETAGQVTQEPEAQPETRDEPEETRPVPANGPMYEWSTEMMAPVKGEVQAAYSAGAPVYSETMKDWRIHAGADLAAQPGEEVKACANGLVKETRADPLLGNVIVVEHGDYVFSYCGVNEAFQVEAGEVVSKGQVLGTVTAVPFEAAQQPHLHLEVRRDGAAMDPMAVLANP